MKNSLYDKLVEYSRSSFYGFHMPGHKRNTDLMGDILPYALDITEIDGFDDLHHAEDILLSLERRLSELYGTEKSWLLINGSTAGILASIMGTVREGDHVLVARNCHRSVYHGLMMSRAIPVYLYPDLCADAPVSGCISPEQVEEALTKDPKIKAVILTSPTYEGIVSDVRRICEAAHGRHIPVIVDEAHGAHLGFHPAFPESAVLQGADLVVQSLHKTLPAMTQTAVLHRQGDWIDSSRVKRFLDIVQTSSPSYVLMASADVCVSMLEERGAVLFSAYVDRLLRVRAKLGQMKALRLFSPPDQEISKIVVLTDGARFMDDAQSPLPGQRLTGQALADLLRVRYKIEIEMASLSYIVAMTSIADTQDGFDRLRDALLAIDGELAVHSRSADHALADILRHEKRVRLPMEEALDRKSAAVPLPKACGRVSGRFVYMYPPGVPYLIPGEEIDALTVQGLEKLMEQGVVFHGTDPDGRLYVL